MDLTRREILTSLGGLAVPALAAPAAASGRPDPSPGQRAAASDVRFPRKDDFAIGDGQTYLNSAYIHPMPKAAADNLRRYCASRATPDSEAWERIDIRSEFAALINAKPSEIALIPNTSTGENLVVDGLGIPGGGGNVVTDALHFEGALLHLEMLKRNGLDVRIVRPRGWRVEIEDLARVVDRNTRLVEVSHVAMFTGHQHDLKAVCDLAHAHGALVYADIAQSAGCTPIDVRATGVDFCACSSFKWLMGDFGLGFLYAREDLLGRLVHRSHYGYYQASSLETHFLPYDAPGPAPLTFELGTGAPAMFEVGSQALAAWAALSRSLPYIRRLGVEHIEAHRQPLLERLRREMPRLGFEPLTPPDSRSALISFAVKDAARYADRLKQAKVDVRLGRHFIRVSPSVFNDMADIERLLAALAP
jgi:selenocysteine lyase/cysteine desulfurase